MTTVLEKIKNMRVTAKRYDVVAAAGHLGIKPNTLLKWFRTYDIDGLNGAVPEFITHDHLLWIAERVKMLSFGKKSFPVIDSTKVRRVLKKNGQPIMRVPDLGKWTPKPSEIKRYLVRFPTALKVEAKNLIDKGYLPIALIAPRLDLSDSAVYGRVRKAKVKAYGVLYNRYAFYEPALVEAAAAGARRASKQAPAEDARQLRLFDKSPPQPVPTVYPRYGNPKTGRPPYFSVLDGEITEAEVKSSLVKARNKDAAEAVVRTGKYMTAQVAADRLGVHATTIRKWFDGRKGVCLTFGRIILYPVVSLKEYEGHLNSKKIKQQEKSEIAAHGKYVAGMMSLAQAAARLLANEQTQDDIELLHSFRAALRIALGLPRAP